MANNKKIDRDIKAQFTLPESALDAIRKAIAQSVASGVSDGFEQADVKKSKKGKTSSSKEPTGAATAFEQALDSATQIEKTTRDSLGKLDTLKIGLEKIAALKFENLETFDKAMESIAVSAMRFEQLMKSFVSILASLKLDNGMPVGSHGDDDAELDKTLKQVSKTTSELGKTSKDSIDEIKGLVAGSKKPAKSEEKKVEKADGALEKVSKNAVELGKNTKDTTTKLAAFKLGLGKIALVLGAVTYALEKFKSVLASVEESSKQLISQNSLFTDKNIMGLMQQTGQSATGATAMQNALDSLGISLSDIQSGMVTETQMAAFQKIYDEQYAQLERVNKVSSEMFASWQSLALLASTETMGLKNSLVEMLGESGIVSIIAEQFKTIMNAIFPFIKDSLFPVVINLFRAFSGVVETLIIAMEPLLPILDLAAKAVNWLVELFTTLLDPINELLKFVGKFLNLNNIGYNELNNPYAGRGEVINSPSVNTNYISNNHAVTTNYNQQNNDLFANGYLVSN